jgi:Cytochrome c554 and c-prime
MSHTPENHKFRRIGAVLTIAAMMAAGALLTSTYADEKEHNFVGSKKCKMCHNKVKEGGQYKIWLETQHAKAFESLASEEGLKAAKAAGVEDPQKSGKCLKCHSTAYDGKEAITTKLAVKKSTGVAYLKVEEGVGCESCHFAGADYKKKKTMKDYDLSVSKGLNPEPKKMCVTCHNDESPFWDTTRYKLADGKTAGFDYEQAWEKIKHMRPEKEDAK